MDHGMQSQEPVFRLLEDPATHNGCAVRRIDTHVSSIFLAGQRAYKIKRAVRFPFLDFSTLDKRKAACEAELEVNKAFAPELYRRVVAITREKDGSLALNGRGAPVEWAVEMQRFDESRTLDHLADAGQIDAALADALGQAVAKAHEAAPVRATATWIAALSSFIDQNDGELRAMPDLFPAKDVAMLTAASRALFERLRPLLVKRGELGLVRRGHGDLHLGNIVMQGGRPVLFDALEFDPRFAAGDVLYDLAFLLMDLVERGLQPAANIALNRYLTATARLEDLDGLAALPLFLSLRAAIRAKVTAARLQFAAAAERAAISRSVRTYFALACRLLQPPPPVLIAIGGLSGTGKSALAKSLAPSIAPIPGAVLLRSDVERKLLFGRAETEPLPPEAYAADVSLRVYGTLEQKAGRVIAAGHSAIADAVFGRPDERDAIAEIARSRGVRFQGLFLTADLETRLGRVGTRSRDASDANARVVQEQERYDLGSVTWTLVDASGAPDEMLRRVREAVGEQP
jgi:uncharacterized protein